MAWRRVRPGEKPIETFIRNLNNSAKRILGAGYFTGRPKTAREISDAAAALFKAKKIAEVFDMEETREAWRTKGLLEVTRSLRGYDLGFGASDVDKWGNPSIPQPATGRIKILLTKIDDAVTDATWMSNVKSAKDKLLMAWKATKAVVTDPVSDAERSQAQDLLDRHFPSAVKDIGMAMRDIERYGPGQGAPDIHKMMREMFPPKTPPKPWE